MARSVYALDSNWDMYLDPVTKRLARLYGSDAIMQAVKSRLLLVQQEWFLDLDEGLPWFTDMFGAGANLFKIRTYIAKRILGTDGVISLKTLTIDFNKAERKLDIYFEYVDETGFLATGGI